MNDLLLPETPDNIKDFWQGCLEATAAQVVNIEMVIQQRARCLKTAQGERKLKLSKEIADLRKRAEEYGMFKAIWAPYIKSDSKVGTIGSFHNNSVKCLQIIDGRTARMECQNIIEFILRRVSTETWTEGRSYEFTGEKGIMQITGTESCTTVLGAARTPRVLEPFDVEIARKYFKPKSAK